ncbi:unnamed protein product [Meloidogyne enterolobii]|uniref:Uncharacterized protein n=1 Tax=Meloidogyne enterolobii TaxID=390850 RepID=A0ACB0ZUA1_MELEN
MDMARRRLNLNKYLKEMAEKVENFNKNLKKIIKKLDNQNLLLKEIKKLKKLEEIKAKVQEEDKAYRERFISKIEFLDKNWNYLVSGYADIGHLFIGYCLAKRFQFIFNNEGQAKTKFYKETKSHLFKYANKINKILGNRRVDLEYYKNLEESFKEKILLKIGKKGEGSSKTVEDLHSFLDNDWGNICAIDRGHPQFEKTDEWALQHLKTVQEDNFHLADMEFMDVEPIDFKQMEFDTNEWAEFKKGALDRLQINRLTFTEAHTFIVCLNKILHKISKDGHEVSRGAIEGISFVEEIETDKINDKELSKYLKEIESIYWQSKEEIKNVFNYYILKGRVYFYLLEFLWEKYCKLIKTPSN